MQKIVLASGNAGKVQEFNGFLQEYTIEVLPQSTFSVPEIAETGSSFEENALLKARNAARHSGLPAVADDSGLEVDALQGAPGIYSARYAGPDASDADNITKLLVAMRDVTADQRGARFRCVLAYVRHADDPEPLICTGAWEGIITQIPHGDGGFGYDPIFLIPPLGKTAAELHPNRKNQLSHRAMALAKLVDRLG